MEENKPPPLNTTEILQTLYDAMPKTTCQKQSCASWCCTKLERSVDQEGQFMPLPLVYGAEYTHIFNYLKSRYTEREIGRRFNFSRDSRVCPFKDKLSAKCLIYPVRPFSCRVYGRKVPPVFWGVTVPAEQAASVACSDMTVDEPEKLESFNQSYPGMWQILSKLSVLQNPFSQAQRESIQRAIGVPYILVLAFGEFYNLQTKSLKWFKENFASYWKKMGEKL